jgi:hypothetical protein
VLNIFGCPELDLQGVRPDTQHLFKKVVEAVAKPQKMVLPPLLLDFTQHVKEKKIALFSGMYF